ncbi:hypothetical protein NDU88_011253 [Pleurodeles waltl]|uniref:Uncharacterized protein n=1 Tax=Pleurodeles waltl TaxID=8319 RepID=A0AAV7QX33_PLEWA|nr:hypothetical protein NDU88_011253 [Pleurodeles waltl]
MCASVGIEDGLCPLISPPTKSSGREDQKRVITLTIYSPVGRSNSARAPLRRQSSEHRAARGALTGTAGTAYPRDKRTKSSNERFGQPISHSTLTVMMLNII